MTPADMLTPDIADAAKDLQERHEPFAFATVIRTAGSTAAKPGAKALLAADGSILQGWLGGGCTRGAVKRAALAALESGEPQLISVAPEEALAEKGVEPGEDRDGVRFARNGCPSRGTVDIFVEPCLPMPELAIYGSSPVARALEALAPQFHWWVRLRDDADPAGQDAARQRVVVVATQGKGDLVALKSALASPARHLAFVGSRKKFGALADKLRAEGIADDDIARVQAPAGLDIGAVTPEEIALSILAELTRVRRDPAAWSKHG